MGEPNISELTKNALLYESTIEVIDGAFYDYVESLNLFCNTSSGWSKIPVIWSSAERAYQLKNNKDIRDINGSLIPPIISIERLSITKDPAKKGNFQANLSPKNDRYNITKVINQEKTSNFANADTYRRNKQYSFVTSKKNKKIVYQTLSIPIPVYVTVEYKISIMTSFQSQMNEAIQPFMTKTAQNYFIIKKNDHRFEAFMDPTFSQEAITDLGEEERKYKSTVTVKVLGQLINSGENQEKPQIITTENAVEVKIGKEKTILENE